MKEYGADEAGNSGAVLKIMTHILCSIIFFLGNRAVYEILLKNMVQPDRPQVTI
jgi:hypothetical protein